MVAIRISKITEERQYGEKTNPVDQQPKTVVQQNWIKALHHHRKSWNKKELSRSSPDSLAKSPTSS